MRTLKRRRTAVGTMLAIVALIVGTTGASAIEPPNHDAPYLSGDFGVHTLIDEGEPYYAIKCDYSGGQLVGFRVRRPIAIQKGSDQYIGWRYVVQGSDGPDTYDATWETRYTSPLEKRLATDKQPAPFTNKQKSLGSLTKTWYRVVIKILWYRPASIVDGRAYLAPDVYESSSGTWTGQNACPSNLGAASTAAVDEEGEEDDEWGEVAAGDGSADPAGPVVQPPNAEEKYVSGDYGLNILIDETDDWGFSGATCRYEGGVLDRIGVRRPIAFARGTQQYVGWRYRIDGTNDLSDPFNALWTPLANGPLEKRLTAPPQPAPFLPRTHQVTNPLDWAYYRVVVRLFWYRPAATIDGRSYMAVESYDDGLLTGELQSFTFGCPALHP